MLNRYRNEMLITFSVEVFMCQHCTTGSGLGYWELRLLCGGAMIDAFHWDKAGWPVIDYKANDEVLVGGRWSTNAKSRFQVVRSTVVMRDAANDSLYSTHLQMELEFGEESARKGNQ